MKPSFLSHARWLWLFAPLAACVQTELVPEILEPALRVDPTTISLQAGETAQLQARYTDAEGIDRPELIVWQSRMPAIATVSANGQLSALAPGQAWVVATAPGSLADSVLVTVVGDSNAVARVDIIGAPATLPVGSSANLQARAYNAAGAELNNLSFSWQSANNAILQVDAAGKATALSPGATTVTASANGINSLPVSIEATPAGGSSRSGQFAGNSGYSVKGTATLEQSGAALRLLLQSDFMASNGPMLGVYLATTASGGLNSQNSLKLANLQANSGMQEYAVPAGVGLQDFNFVVIYCIPFNVRFGTAQLNN